MNRLSLAFAILVARSGKQVNAAREAFMRYPEIQKLIAERDGLIAQLDEIEERRKAEIWRDSPRD